MNDLSHDEQAPAVSGETPALGRFVSVAGRRVHILRAGFGQRVLLLHGNSSLGEEILSAFQACAGMTWIAPDRPGYGLSEPLPAGCEDPASLGRWIGDLLDALGLRAAHLVAHSLAAGGALCFASEHPDRVLSLTLVSPFCRPTPHRWMPGLRVAVLPVVGRVVRAVLPVVAGRLRNRVLARLTEPDPVPQSLAGLPVAHAAQPRAVLTTAAELRRFNAGMLAADPKVDARVPVVAMFGTDDQTAVPDWHAPWLREHIQKLDLRILPGYGHMLHHLKPLTVWAAVLSAIAAARPRDGAPTYAQSALA